MVILIYELYFNSQFAIDRASSRAKRLLEAALTDPSQVTQEMRENFQRETADLFRSVGAREIQVSPSLLLSDPVLIQ